MELRLLLLGVTVPGSLTPENKDRPSRALTDKKEDMKGKKNYRSSKKIRETQILVSLGLGDSDSEKISHL